MLVLDASAAIAAAHSVRGLAVYGREELVAPAILWSEARSVLHEAVWRGELVSATALEILRRLEDGGIRLRSHRRLSERAWAIADTLGWAKTYDAEYVALAELLGCRLVTTDARLRRGAERLGFVVGPNEL